MIHRFIGLTMRSRWRGKGSHRSRRFAPTWLLGFLSTLPTCTCMGLFDSSDMRP